MAVDCGDAVAVRQQLCDNSSDMKEIINNDENTLTNIYSAKPVAMLVKEKVNADLQKLGIDYVWANSTERNAQTGMISGQQGYQSDVDEVYKYTTSWAFYFSIGAVEFLSNVFRINDNSDSSKQLDFDVSGVTTGTKRTLTVPDENGTIATKKIFIYTDTTPSGTNGYYYPYDSNVPLITQGGEVESLSITPPTNSSKIRVKCTTRAHHQGGIEGTVAVFRDNICIYAFNDSGNQDTALFAMDIVDEPNTTSSVTYSIRVGSTNSAWYYWSMYYIGHYGGAGDKGTFSLEEL